MEHIRWEYDCDVQGNKVKLVMKFEGRELMFKEQGKEVLLVSQGGKKGSDGYTVCKPVPGMSCIDSLQPTLSACLLPICILQVCCSHIVVCFHASAEIH